MLHVTRKFVVPFHVLVQVLHYRRRPYFVCPIVVSAFFCHLLSLSHAHQVVVIKLLECFLVCEVKFGQQFGRYDVLVATVLLSHNFEVGLLAHPGAGVHIQVYVSNFSCFVH